jgi:hypothetical protein
MSAGNSTWSLVTVKLAMGAVPAFEAVMQVLEKDEPHH